MAGLSLTVKPFFIPLSKPQVICLSFVLLVITILVSIPLSTIFLKNEDITIRNQLFSRFPYQSKHTRFTSDIFAKYPTYYFKNETLGVVMSHISMRYQTTHVFHSLSISQYRITGYLPQDISLEEALTIIRKLVGLNICRNTDGAIIVS
ncbi:FecR domain-containing protein [Chitinophaga sancti]|uniref:Protein FecR C-terminal domain-containing protein n=1 Tax=Chitinophaga sancti TaxID=1004 RepID=A0A1K1SW45_9BACT|nr:protein of unknown function [Chitinophaga sancti]